MSTPSIDFPIVAPKKSAALPKKPREAVASLANEDSLAKEKTANGKSELINAQLILPSKGLTEAVIREAIAMEQACEPGEIVYEVLSRKTIFLKTLFFKRKSLQTLVSYRCLPKAQWETLVFQKHRLPLIPQAEKLRLLAHRQRLVEMVVLSISAFLLLAFIAFQRIQIGVMQSYQKNLSAMIALQTPASTVAVKRPQERWAGQLNAVVHDLAAVGGHLSYFEFTPNGNVLKVAFKGAGVENTNELGNLLSQSLQREVSQLKEGLWSWQD